MVEQEKPANGVAGIGSGGETVRVRIAETLRAHQDLYSGEAKAMNLAELLKAESLPATSGQAVATGIKSRPFNMVAVARLKNANEWHSACIEAKNEATVGLGHEDETVHESLDPLCDEGGWQGVLNESDEDYWNVGQGHIEVVRDIEKADSDNAPIVGLHFLPATEVRVVVEDQEYNSHYEITSSEGNQRRFAKFGELARLRKKFDGDKSMKSEVIRFKQSSSLSRWYGYPDWLAGVTAIEIVQMLNQHTFDFFLNRCVPEFLLFVLGKKVGDADWAKLEEVFKQHIGLGNSRKSSAFNFEGTPDEMAVQLEKLGIDQQGQGGFFTDFNDPLSLRIVTAHGVPPLLAGIQIAGKLGAANEMSNAMLAFQALKIGPTQRARAAALDQTLGNPEKNGGLGRELGRGGRGPLKRGQFKFKSVVDEISAGLVNAMSQGDNAGGAASPLDTAGRARTALPVMAARGRNLTDGVRT